MSSTIPVQSLIVRMVEGAWIANADRLTVEVDSTTKIYDLRDIIVSKARSQGLIDVEESLELWSPNSDIIVGLDAAERVTENLHGSTLADLATPIDDIEIAESIMRKTRSKRQSNYIHVLAVVLTPLKHPAPKPSVPVGMVELINQNFRRLLLETSATKSPSVNSKSTHYSAHQSGPNPILDGRYAPLEESPATQGPPIELFHPVFARFRALASDATIEIPPGIVSATASFMRSASAIQTTERARTLPSRIGLANILKRSFSQNVNSDRTSAYHVALGSAKHLTIVESTALALVEEKSEMGTGGDPSVQGCFSYTKFWLGTEHVNVRNECCCPTFIIALAGSGLAVLGAVTTSWHIAQRLTDFLWLGNSRVNDDAHVISVARILYALKCSIESLDTFYEGLTVRRVAHGSVHPRFLPSITMYSLNDTSVTFTYVRPLEVNATCMTFLATLDSDGRNVVVKFVQRYGDAVHRLLAEIGMAPDLLYYGPIQHDGHSYGELKMIVMGYVDGGTLAQLIPEPTAVPQAVLDTIRNGVTAIHDAGYVYGDLRRPNVMITAPVDGVDISERVRFIDFDWAGQAGAVRYPLHLSREICDTVGTSEYQLILKEHDLIMIDAL